VELTSVIFLLPMSDYVGFLGRRRPIEGPCSKEGFDQSVSISHVGDVFCVMPTVSHEEGAL